MRFMRTKYLFLLAFILLPIEISSETYGFLIKPLNYYIECSSKILDENLEEIESNDQDILHICRGGYGELNKLTISSDETGFERVLNLEMFHDYSYEQLEHDEIWTAENENIILSYDEFINFPRILITIQSPRKHYMLWIKKIYIIGGKNNDKYTPVEIEEFKDDFIQWLKNEEED